MPAFAFDALDLEGRPRRGIVEADTERAVRNQLRAQSLVPLSVKAVACGAGTGRRPGWALLASRGRVLGPGALTLWTRQLADMVCAGLPLEQALAALAEDLDDERQRALVAALRAEVNGGSSLARALALHPREFSAIYRAVVHAGEQSGQLGLVLDRLARDLAEHQALRGKVLAAVLYPAIVTLLALGIVGFLLGYVVPHVAQVYVGRQHALPVLTALMLGLSAGLRQQGPWLVAGLLLTVPAARAALRVQRVREGLDAWWLRLPLVGRLAGSFNAARFASTLGLLAGAGVPILDAMQAAADTLGNASMRAGGRRAVTQVREGASLAAALAGERGFPNVVTRFSRLGEQTGALPLMLQRAASLLSDDVQRRALQMATILEPVLIVGMGLVVMLIVLAVLLPIIELNQWAG